MEVFYLLMAVVISAYEKIFADSKMSTDEVKNAQNNFFDRLEMDKVINEKLKDFQSENRENFERMEERMKEILQKLEALANEPMIVEEIE